MFAFPINLVPGQSVTTPGGGPWNNLTFNFFFGGGIFPSPTAAGTLFLLSQEFSVIQNPFSATPNDLSSATPGYIAQSQSISGGRYVFDSSVTLLPNTQYFFYYDSPMTSGGALASVFNGYLGGQYYQAIISAAPIAPVPTQDWDFLLSGDVVVSAPPPSAVPEPASLLLLGTGIAALVFKRRRAK
jgi:hypothetical protein